MVFILRINYDIISIKIVIVKQKKEKEKCEKSIILPVLKCSSNIYNIGISILGTPITEILSPLSKRSIIFSTIQTVYFYLHSFTFLYIYREFRSLLSKRNLFEITLRRMKFSYRKTPLFHYPNASLSPIGSDNRASIAVITIDPRYAQ